MTNRWKRGAAEFVVIFAGVTLSLAADDWRETRSKGEERLAVLEQLRADLSDDVAEHRFVRDRAGRLAASSEWLVGRWSEEELLADSIAFVLSAFSLPIVFEYRSPAYSGLKGSSGLSLISRSGLGQDLIRYFESEQVHIVNFARALSDSQVRAAEALYPFVDLPPYERGAWPERMDLVVPWRQVRQDQVLRNRVMEVNQYSELTLLFVEPADDLAQELIQRIDQELVRKR